jgi:homogentisate phytyltransferase / homogentisate geranylgeranyltransferase
MKPALQPSIVPLSFTKQPIAWLYSFWKFARPHTIIGTSLSVIGLYFVAFSDQVGRQNAAWEEISLYSVPLTLAACLSGNVYIVGLNQLEDVDIDRINKPHLPIAAGEFSQLQGTVLVAIAGIGAIALAAAQSPYLFAMVGISLLIGTAYSLPPIRLKRFPSWASLCIFTVRGIIVNLGLFLHFRSILQPVGSSFGVSLDSFPASVLALTGFVLVFTFAIAIFKDIPDAEGDRKYNISTFTLQMGQQRVFNLTRWVLTLCYSGMIIAGILSMPGVNRWVLIGAHGALLALFWWQSLRVDLNDKAAIARFYQFIWKLFFLEYVLFPVACLLQF